MTVNPLTSDRRQALGVVLPVLALLLLYAPALAHALDVWRTDQEFSFGFLVPPLTLRLLWSGAGWRRPSPGAGLGLPVLLGGLACCSSGTTAASTPSPAPPSCPPRWAPPAFFGSGGGPRSGLPAGLLHRRTRLLSRPAQHGRLRAAGGVTARLAATLARLLGVPVRRSGVDLFVGRFHFVVAGGVSRPEFAAGAAVPGHPLGGLAWPPLARRLTLVALILESCWPPTSCG